MTTFHYDGPIVPPLSFVIGLLVFRIAKRLRRYWISCWEKANKNGVLREPNFSRRKIWRDDDFDQFESQLAYNKCASDFICKSMKLLGAGFMVGGILGSLASLIQMAFLYGRQQ